MAQHIDADRIDNKRVQQIVASIRKQKYFKTSMKFSELPYADKENASDEVYGCDRSVPESIVYGGRAFFEIHTKPAINFSREVTNIFLVA